MFLHIGNGVTVRQKDIIGIFDLDTASMSADTRRFLRDADKNGILLDAANGDIPRSFLFVGKRRRVTNPDEGLEIKFSLISTAGLKLRVLRAAEDAEE